MHYYVISAGQLAYLSAAHRQRAIYAGEWLPGADYHRPSSQAFAAMTNENKDV